MFATFPACCCRTGIELLYNFLVSSVFVKTCFAICVSVLLLSVISCSLCNLTSSSCLILAMFTLPIVSCPDRSAVYISIFFPIDVDAL